MDDKEREKVEAAAKEFWFRTGGHPYGEHIMPDSFARQVAAFHLAETETLRKQLADAHKVIKEYAEAESWSRRADDPREGLDCFMNTHDGYDAARAYLEKWSVE